MSDKPKWTVPPELAAYGTYTNYPGRAEELINSDATFKNNIIVAAMAVEMDAQYRLLARLREAGLLLHPDDRHLLCRMCKRSYGNGCPDCDACERACYVDSTNECTHPSMSWGKR